MRRRLFVFAALAVGSAIVVLGARHVRAQSAGPEIFNVTIPIDEAPMKTVLVTTAPMDRVLVITDLDGSYTCGYLDLQNVDQSVPYGDCYLTNGQHVRFQWLVQPAATALYGLEQVAPHRSWTTGLRFEPGESVYWQADEGHILWGRLTVMGRLMPTG